MDLSWSKSTMKSIASEIFFLRFAHLRCQHPSLQVICRSWLRHPVGNLDRRDNLCSCEGWIPKMTRHQRLSLPWKFILRPCKKAVKCLAFLSSLDPCCVLILYVFVVKQKSTWELPEARCYGYGVIRLSDFWDCIGYNSIFTLNILCMTVFCCPWQVVSWNASIQEYALMVITFTCFLKSRRMSCHTWAVKHTLVVWVNEVIGHTSIPTNKYNGMGQRLMLCGSFGPVLNSFHSVGEDS